MKNYFFTESDYGRLKDAIENLEFDVYDEDVQCAEVLKDTKTGSVEIGGVVFSFEVTCECNISIDYRRRAYYSYDYTIDSLEGMADGERVLPVYDRAYVENELSWDE